MDDPVLGAARKVARFTVDDEDTGPTENPAGADRDVSSTLSAGGEYWLGWSTLFPRRFRGLRAADGSPSSRSTGRPHATADR